MKILFFKKNRSLVQGKQTQESLLLKFTRFSTERNGQKIYTNRY